MAKKKKNINEEEGVSKLGTGGMKEKLRKNLLKN